jgi:hypothetical protein
MVYSVIRKVKFSPLYIQPVVSMGVERYTSVWKGVGGIGSGRECCCTVRRGLTEKCFEDFAVEGAVARESENDI